MKKEIDRPIAQLIRDLDKTGKLDRTLVIVASEFSRDAMIEGKPGSNARDQSQARVNKLKEISHYGLHRHFTGGTSVAMFGGGVKKGFVYGKTADERPLMAIENPGFHRRPARNHLYRHGHQSENRVRRRKRPSSRPRTEPEKPATGVFA